VEELAHAVGLTENGVRVHLATLERDGWIHADGVRRPPGPGKPPTVYRLADRVEALLSAAYRPLLLALLNALSSQESPARVARLLRSAGKRLAASLGDFGSGPAEERAVTLLTALGAEVLVEQGSRGRFVVRGFGCPVADAVAAEPRSCLAVTALLAGVLDARVVERCDKRGEPRCRFEITPRDG
jgi:predicted ArsR family transcriptional regulator